MDEKWRIGRVSTPERIFEKIITEMAQPVGIVLIGADCDLKDEVFMACVECIPNLATGYGGKGGNMGLRAAKQPLSAGRSVLTVMYGMSSGYPKERLQVVEALRDLGAKTVVGIYVRTTVSPEQCENIADFQAISAQVQRLKNHPPKDEEFDYLITKEG